MSVGTVTLTTTDPDQQNIQVKNITINEGFIPSTRANNLALLQVLHFKIELKISIKSCFFFLKLTSIIKFTANVLPIGVAEVNPADNSAMIVGWGVTVLVN